ncbi:Glutathione S-transferase domain protein [Hyella patelloides LEGE 07179]|uniref:Glutathione S-transferase domain protein n=1 Tax=Hyella patelloides LEGE 07179 TaxID=945734 RepID=A0A563VKM4_9CYAN|nr:glutathione S-transferase family protein [Hyella patelloides]VEP11968.1 Glutathione S-transferase domain protein [Hyella patelloides LEGE 07179]
MGIPKLVIGNKNYSSWSLRAWLILAKLDIKFEEIQIPLFSEGYQEKLFRYSPTGKVPVYIEDELTIWDSLAIAEYLAERYPTLLPSDFKQRALARSVSAEMHSSFFSLRSKMPMNCRAKDRHVESTEELTNDIQRIQAIWTTCRNQNRKAGSWLFGDFTIVDAMFAPVVFRFNTYGVECDSIATEYMKTVLNDSDIKRWYEASKNEPEIIEQVEVGLN